MRQIVLLSAAMAAASTTALADEVGGWYFTPQIGGIVVDNERPLQDKDWLYGLAIGKHLSKPLSVELALNGAQVGGGTGRSDLSTYGASVDLLGVFLRDSRVSPYLSIGTGIVQNEPSPGDNDTDFMAQAGFGLLVTLWESPDGRSSWSLRPDFKARMDDAGAEGHLVDYIGTLGFQYSFGGTAKEAPRAPEPPPPAPPPPEPAVAAPAAPPPPPDTDGDGVTDDIDKCPGTPPGVAVDATGCPQKGSITLEGVNFEYNSAELTAESKPVLDDVAKGLQKFPRLKVELQGHSDSTGPEQYNLALSQKRADAAREYLLGQGVSATQIVARGYGEGQPVADNSSEEGRAKNRRVVMFVLDNPGDVEVKGEGVTEGAAPAPEQGPAQ